MVFHRIVNVDSLEYLDPHAFGDGGTMAGVVVGGRMMGALAWLLREDGSWVGQRLVLACSSDPPTTFLPQHVARNHNLWDLCVTHPDFTDISERVLRLMLHEPFNLRLDAITDFMRSGFSDPVRMALPVRGRVSFDERKLVTDQQSVALDMLAGLGIDNTSKLTELCRAARFQWEGGTDI